MTTIDGEVLAKIAEMSVPDRAMANRLHAVIKASAPALSLRLWYGMPAYANDGKGRLLLPKRAEVQIEVRDVRLQRRGEPRRGALWPTAFALKELTAAEDVRIGALVKKAVS